MIKRDEAYQKLRDAIIYGNLYPGEKLVETEICKRLNVGRTPLREAIHRMQEEGYVEVSPNKSAVVRSFPISELEDLHDILAVLEAYAVETSTKLLSEKEKESLKKIIKQSDKINDPSDYRKWRDFNATFHEFFWKKSGNPVLFKTLTEMRKKTYLATRMIIIPVLLGNLKKYKEEHSEIVELVLKGDAVKAGNKMKMHVQKAKDIFTKYLNNEKML